MVLRCHRVYDQNVLEKILIDTLPKFIPRSLRLYQGFKKYAVHYFAEGVKSLPKFQIASQSSEATKNKVMTEILIGNIEHRGGQTSNVESNTSSSMVLRSQSASSRNHRLPPCRYDQATSTPSTAATSTEVIFPLDLNDFNVKRALLLHLTAPSHASTKCPDIPLQFCAIRFREGQA